MKVLERIIKKKAWSAIMIAISTVIVSISPCPGVTIIDFDDRFGMPGPYNTGKPVPPEYLVNDEYLSLGVMFDSGGGGIFIAESSNPVSPPNSASPTAPGPVMSWTDPVVASFWADNLPGMVDYVSIILSDTSETSTLTAYTYDGKVLGSDTDGPSATLTVDFPGQIHSVRIEKGPFAFDDFTFDGLIPEPATILLLGLGGLAAVKRRGI